jgi:hypothetical protein
MCAQCVYVYDVLCNILGVRSLTVTKRLPEAGENATCVCVCVCVVCVCVVCVVCVCVWCVCVCVRVCVARVKCLFPTMATGT